MNKRDIRDESKVSHFVYIRDTFDLFLNVQQFFGVAWALNQTTTDSQVKFVTLMHLVLQVALVIHSLGNCGLAY